MSTINLYEAYNQKLNKFGLNDSARFQSSFVEAVNLTYAELNDQVFQNQTLGYINSFDDVIDERLHFTSLTLDSDANTALDDREFWTVEYELVKGSDTNTFLDTISDGASNVVISITNGVLTVTGAAITATATLPETETWDIKFESHIDGNTLTVNGTETTMTYSSGDADTAQGIGTVSAHVIVATKLELIRTRFLSVDGVVYEFLINEGTGSTLTDEVNGYGIVIADPTWITLYVEPSSGLDSQYRAVFNMAIDYHLQDGGEWSIEPEPERERKWYGRGIKMARNIYQNNSTYTPPLGDY